MQIFSALIPDTAEPLTIVEQHPLGQPVLALNGNACRLLFNAAYDWLAHHHEEVNRLNVFPVPDGDTGTNMSLTLQYFDKHASPWVFGKLRSISAASSIIVGLFIFFMASVLDFTRMYMIIGGLIVALALWGFTRKPTNADIVPQRKKMIFRRRYWLFYFLTFMAGARRQIFIAFSVLLLVQKFGYSVQAVTFLFVVNNIINYFLSPTIGRAIIRFGERKVLSLEYASLIAVFLAYATTDSKWVAGGLYILDHIFFNFGMAINTFFQKMGDPGDVAPTMAVGFTINHIAAVFLPAIGGYFWVVDYRIPFIAGAAMAMVSLAAVQQIRDELRSFD